MHIPQLRQTFYPQRNVASRSNDNTQVDYRLGSQSGYGCTPNVLDGKGKVADGWPNPCPELPERLPPLAVVVGNYYPCHVGLTLQFRG